MEVSFGNTSYNQDAERTNFSQLRWHCMLVQNQSVMISSAVSRTHTLQLLAWPNRKVM